MATSSLGIFNSISGLHGMTDFPLKQLITWGDHLKVDQPNIDAQHEGIFNIAIEIANAWRQHGNLDRLRELADKLDKVLQAHFRFEEQQLEEVNFPNLAEHKAEHKVMIDELQMIRTRLERMGDGTAGMEPGFLIHNFVLGVTVGHIAGSDMEYCVFARNAAQGKEKVWPSE